MWKKLSSKVLFQHPRLIVEEDEVQLQSGETIQYLKYGYHGDGVVIVARNEQDEILFIREYSYIPDRKFLQLPMGKIEDGENAEVAANRELQEETDLKASQLKQFGYYYQYHRRADNKGYVVLATSLSEAPMPGDKEEEDLELVWVKISDIQQLIEKGEIVDADTLSSLSVASLKLALLIFCRTFFLNS